MKRLKMSQVSVSQAAELVGLSEKTIYKHMKAGRITGTLSVDGRKSLETSELLRFYGAFKQNNVAHRIAGPSPETEILVSIATLKAENEGLKNILLEKEKRIELITYTQVKKDNQTWLWVTLAIVISVLATNLAYKFPNPF